MDYRELVNLGLTEKEAKVYLAGLELGKSPVQKISEKAGVNRATTYVQIESLTKKGLMSSYVEGKKQFFCSEAPEKLNLLFREQEMAIQRKEEYLSKLLPELKALKTSDNDKPVVRYFEGKDGLRAMAEEIFISNNESESQMIYSRDLLKEVFNEEELSLLRSKRKNEKISVKAIINDEKGDLKSDATSHILSSSEFPITSDIAFFKDKVRIATQKGHLVGLIIENKEIASTLKILFELAWKYLEENDKKKKSSK